MEDNKDLLNEIDKLDDTEEVIKVRHSLHEKIFTAVILLIIIGALTMLYFSYTGKYIVANKESKLENISSYLENVMYEENAEGENTEELDYEVLKQQQIQKFEEQKAQLNITTQINDINNNLVAILNNSNQENISNVKVQVIFYDAENKPVKIDEQFISIIEANMDYYMSFQNTPADYARYDFLITKDKYNFDYTSYSNSITYEVQEKEDGKVKIVGKNTTENKILGIDFFVVYYNENNEIISVKTVGDFDIKKNKEFKAEFYNCLYNDSDYSEVAFARYEVILAGAYSYIEEN